MLETGSVPRRGQVLWADRVQTVWGRPVVRSDPSRHLSIWARRSTSSVFVSVDSLAADLGVNPDEQIELLELAVNLIVGGFMAFAVRELYKRFGTTTFNREQFASMLPLFTLVTIMVVYVVNVSLALSLGLIGALTLVRFRTAIRSHEEMTYLFFCVGIGLALGAGQRLLAFVAILVAIPFILWRRRVTSRASGQCVSFDLAGDRNRFFDGHANAILEILNRTCPDLTVQRLDDEGGGCTCRPWRPWTVEKIQWRSSRSCEVDWITARSHTWMGTIEA